MPSASMQVRTNIATQTAHREMRQLSAAKTNAAHRLSSGFRINSAADDPAGLAITETMTTQIRGLDQAAVNAQDGMSMLQTAEGGMEGIAGKLHRIRELLVQAANDTNTPENRAQINMEIQQLIDGIDDMALRAEFNGFPLLDGRWATEDPANPGWSLPGSPGHHAGAAVTPDALLPYVGDNDVHLQIGANSGQGMNVGIGGVSAHHLGLRLPNGDRLIATDGPTVRLGQDALGLPILETVSMQDAQSISRQIEWLDEALDYINTERAKLGAVRVRLEHTRQANTVSSNNLSEARSRVRDADMAREMMDFTQINILFQAGTAMLAHGNRLPETVLTLLR